jgi:hypothetical protein
MKLGSWEAERMRRWEVEKVGRYAIDLRFLSPSDFHHPITNN